MQSICCTLTSACVCPRVSTPITLNQALLKQVASAEHSVDPGQCETDRTSTTRRWKIELHLHCWAATQDFSGQTGGVSVRSVSLEQTQHIVCSPRTADCYYTTVLFPHFNLFYAQCSPPRRSRLKYLNNLWRDWLTQSFIQVGCTVPNKWFLWISLSSGQTSTLSGA